MKKRFIIGIDETGRGCLAGPITVSAVLLPVGFKEPKNLPKLRDSKKMTAFQREKWRRWAVKEHKQNKIIFSVSNISPKIIDEINISSAANFGAWRCFKKIIELHKKNKHCDKFSFNAALIKIILDGGLFLRNKEAQRKIALSPIFSQISSVNTIIKADDKFLAVKLASVMAKTSRDSYMKKISTKYPDFKLDIHKGYGVKEHIKIIKTCKNIPVIYRKSFLKKIASDLT